MKQMYKTLDIVWYSNEIKASIEEILILTIKKRIVKFIALFNHNEVLSTINRKL